MSRWNYELIMKSWYKKEFLKNINLISKLTNYFKKIVLNKF